MITISNGIWCINGIPLCLSSAAHFIPFKEFLTTQFSFNLGLKCKGVSDRGLPMAEPFAKLIPNLQRKKN